MKELEFKFIDVWDVLRKYYSIIIGCAVIFTVISFVGNYYIFAKVYEASTTLYIWNSSSEGANVDSSTAYRDIVFYDRLVNDYKQLIESKRVKNAVHKSLEVKNEIYQILKQKHKRENLSYTVYVELKRNTRMIRIKAQSTDPQIACFAANSTAAVFIDTVYSMMEMKNIKVIDVAEVPAKAIKPKKIRNMFIALFLGLCAGFGIGFILKILDNTIKNPEEIAENFNIPMLGMVPEFITSNKNKLLQRTSNHIYEHNMISSDNTNTPFSEAFKVIRNNIQYSSPDQPLKIIMVSSANQSAGKTTIAGNLAFSIAMSGKKVLVVDCDLRRPALHSVFGIKNEFGIVDCLIHKASPEDCIQKNVLDGVDIMSCGSIPPNPSELLMSETFQSIIASLQDKYDYILLDAPPAAINLADAAIIGRAADGCLFVLRANSTRYDLANHAIEQLQQIDGNKIIGLVLNCFAFKNTQYYHYCSDSCT